MVIGIKEDGRRSLVERSLVAVHALRLICDKDGGAVVMNGLDRSISGRGVDDGSKEEGDPSDAGLKDFVHAPNHLPLSDIDNISDSDSSVSLPQIVWVDSVDVGEIDSTRPPPFDSSPPNTTLRSRLLIRVIRKKISVVDVNDSSITDLSTLSEVNKVSSEATSPLERRNNIVSLLKDQENKTREDDPRLKSTIEMETTSTCLDGRRVICDNDECIAAIVQRMLKVLSVGTERAVVVLWSLCHLFRDPKAQGIVIQMNGLTKILLLMQSDFAPKENGRKKGEKIEPKNRGYGKASDTDDKDGSTPCREFSVTID
ncbi:hypothetical protein ACLOJK_033397 [Asimina triloba]